MMLSTMGIHAVDTVVFISIENRMGLSIEILKIFSKALCQIELLFETKTFQKRKW